MKTQNVIAIIILEMVVVLGIVAVCCANPFLQSNTQASATTYTITGGPSFIPSSVSTTNGQMRVDLANYTQGTWPIVVRACKTDPMYGQQCSPTTNYTLTCPSPTGGLTAPVITIVAE